MSMTKYYSEKKIARITYKTNNHTCPQGWADGKQVNFIESLYSGNV